MENKIVAVYKFRSSMFIQGYSETTDGVGQLDGPVFTAEAGDMAQLGDNILKALEGAGKIIPHPTYEEIHDKNRISPMLQAAKMKTWNAMMKASKSVLVRFYRDQIILTPFRFGGTRGDTKGYHPMEDKAITCTDLSPETLGKALIQAFELCE